VIEPLQGRISHPTNRFAASQRMLDSSGTLVLAVVAPGPGSFDVMVSAAQRNLALPASVLQAARGRFVFARAHATAAHAGARWILVRPNWLGRLLVKHHAGRVTLRVWVTFTPKGGRPRTIGLHSLKLPRR
jgi:hypothetical protein